MPDLIKLLPDSVANQIAAGEVVQRPASAVKELLENSIDSGATEIKLIIKDSGKTLIQVIDNGCGMSERDARMCFERHATSKIQSANDLMVIRTLGFRGEALASIASIAQVELKTKRTEDEVGSLIQIEGSEIKDQYPSPCQDGTTVSVRNLFFNVPARRNFLKSNTLELKYIIDEFFRVALVNCDTGFTFINNEKILYKLVPSNLKQRVVALFGGTYNQRLVPVEQSSAIVNITGFIGKPEFARKTRGEQYFFTNNRFIKSPYLHHAIENAYQELIPKDSFPSYFIYLSIDPKMIDVNIHPTKTEINFQDIKNIFAVLHSSVRQSIGKFNITPSFDFEVDKSFELPPPSKDQPILQPKITIDPTYNPFEKRVKSQFEIPLPVKTKPGDANWQKLYDPLKEVTFHDHPFHKDTDDNQRKIPGIDEQTGSAVSSKTIQAMNRFIITCTKSGVMIIDQQNAHERILFEKFLSLYGEYPWDSQQQLLPISLNLRPSEAELLKEYLNEFNKSGFEIASFGKDAFIISAIPVGCSNENIAELFDKMLEKLQKHPVNNNSEKHQQFVHGLAKSMSISRGQKLHPEEQAALVENLLACKVPDITPDGKPTIFFIGFDELNKKFK
jgi:DNA mismatch repair protein MutL